MARHIITFEVDDVELFDEISKLGDGGAAIGTRLVGVMLAPNDVGLGTKLGMRAYGVDLLKVQPAPDETQEPA